jgi:hypothetical protein
MQIPWRDISYLSNGNERQRAAYRVLGRLRVLSILCDHTPVLVGTIPLDIDIEGSDLDIVCQVCDLSAFQHLVVAAFGQQEGFRIKRKLMRGVPSVVANFVDEFPIEVFGQPRPVTEQNAYRHMLVEARLLAIGGEPARREIRSLKRAGLKTEPAFARYFCLEGDPYSVLWRLSFLSEDALREQVLG